MAPPTTRAITSVVVVIVVAAIGTGEVSAPTGDLWIAAAIVLVAAILIGLRWARRPLSLPSRMSREVAAGVLVVVVAALYWGPTDLRTILWAAAFGLVFANALVRVGEAVFASRQAQPSDPRAEA